MSIGKRIRFFRKRAGMTQRELGLSVGFMPVSADVRIAQYENGSRTPKADLRLLLADALGVSSAALEYPEIETESDMMQTLFALEDYCGLTIAESEAGYYLEFPYNGDLLWQLGMDEWKNKQKRLRTGEITKEEYDDWRYRHS